MWADSGFWNGIAIPFWKIANVKYPNYCKLPRLMVCAHLVPLNILYAIFEHITNQLCHMLLDMKHYKQKEIQEPLWVRMAFTSAPHSSTEQLI